MDDLIEETEHHVRVAASQVARRFRGFVTYADLVQEGYVWVIRHPATVGARMEDGRRGEQRLVNQLAKYMEKQARKERAASLRYRPEDEAFYQRALVEAALPAIWDDNLMTKPPMDEEPVGKSVRDPAETSSWLVTVLDVRTAWQRADLNSDWRLALAYRYGEGMKLYQVAAVLQVSEETAQSYIDKGLRKLIDELGGPAPSPCPPDCECGHGRRAGGRRVMTNAEARARTADDYDE